MQFQWFYSGSFAYDSAGNPTTFKGTSQGFNGNNQQTSNGTFVYDGNGNPTTYRGSGFTFDPENRATAIGATWTAGYRADGLRGWKSVSGTKTYYLYDQGEPVVELNAAGSVQATNVLAPDGLVARQQSGTWTQYTFDQQGNVAQRLNASQVVTSSSTYDAYGIESSSGTPNDVFGYNARWGYLLDRETGLYLCQHRYYDPGTGRWVNRDPIGVGGGINIYAYAGGSPNFRTDSSGYGFEEVLPKLIVGQFPVLGKLPAGVLLAIVGGVTECTKAVAEHGLSCESGRECLKGLLDAILCNQFAWAGFGAGSEIGWIGGPLGSIVGGVIGGFAGIYLAHSLSTAISEYLVPCREECPSASGAAANSNSGGSGRGLPSGVMAC